jgi:L-fucose isomerase
MDEMKQAVYGWPQGFVKLKADPEEFLTEVGSNHLHAVYGDWVNDLIKISNNLAIKYKVFD